MHRSHLTGPILSFDRGNSTKSEQNGLEADETRSSSRSDAIVDLRRQMGRSSTIESGHGDARRRALADTVNAVFVDRPCAVGRCRVLVGLIDDCGCNNARRHFPAHLFHELKKSVCEMRAFCVQWELK